MGKWFDDIGELIFLVVLAFAFIIAAYAFVVGLAHMGWLP